MSSFFKSLLRRPVDAPRLEVETAHPVMRSEPEASFLWLDAPDAGERIDRRRRNGEITRAEAELLRHWARDGYVVLERCVPHETIDAALEDLDAVWRERRHVSLDLLSDGRRTYVDEVAADARRAPYKVNDLYVSSENVRRVFFDERVVRFGELVFGDRVVGCNSLTFEHGTQQPAHVDHAYMTPGMPRRLIAAWVACEDVAPTAGPLVVWAGSHRLPPYDFGGGRYHYTPEQDAEHAKYLDEQKGRFERREFLAGKGDVLVWHSMLIHGGDPIRESDRTRRSMAFHYYSNECVGPDAGPIREYGRALYMDKPPA